MEYIIILCIALGLSFVPMINRYLSLINTFIHESGHAVMTLIMGGRNHSISLFHTGGGLAIGGTRSTFARFLVLIAGYVSASAASYGMIYALYHDQINIIFWGFVGLILVNLIFWVRNVFGFVWTLSFLGIFSVLYFYAPPFMMFYTLLFFAYVLSIESWKSAWTVLKLSAKQPKDAGDATFLRQVTHLPAVFWGIIFFAQSCFFVLCSLKLYLF